jgi:hypothetical protein
MRSKLNRDGQEHDVEIFDPWRVSTAARINVDAPAFDEFEARLQRPSRPIEGLRELTARPTIFVDAGHEERSDGEECLDLYASFGNTS